MERPDRAYSHADRQGFEVEDVQDLDCERGEGYFYWVRHFLTRSPYRAKRPLLGRCPSAPAYHVTENEQYMKSQSIKLRVYKVICLAVKHHGHGPAAQTSVMQSLQYYEHLSEPMAECLNVLLKEFDHARRSSGRLLRRASMRKIPRAQGTFLGSSRNSQNGLREQS
jgi:non-SMC mitotic condensation complex subunit 1, N-term